MIRSIILIILSTFLLPYSTTSFNDCQLPCQLELNQADNLTVQSVMDNLVDRQWVPENAVSHLSETFSYAKDAFSSVLVTRLVIYPGKNAPALYQSGITLYTGYIGTVKPDFPLIPSASVEAIQVESHLTILQTLLLYGLPQGGQVLPYYVEGDLSVTNPCPDRSHYIAFYDEGRTIIRATVKRPILLNLWTTPVQMVYPVGATLKEYATYPARYERMDHRPCLQN